MQEMFSIVNFSYVEIIIIATSKSRPKAAYLFVFVLLFVVNRCRSALVHLSPNVLSLLLMECLQHFRCKWNDFGYATFTNFGRPFGITKQNTTQGDQVKFIVLQLLI